VPKVIRQGVDESAGHDPFEPRVTSQGNSSNVYVNGILAVIVGNEYVDHITDHDPETKETATSGSPNVLINNTPIHRAGDSISCDEVAANGSPNVFVNGD
jgi:uncharacterized Zn-binding protein involved in type VI secretion